MNLPRRVKRAFSAFMGTDDKPVYVVKRSAMRPEDAKALGDATGAVVVMADDLEAVTRVGKPAEELGDGQAAFLGSGTHEEFIQQQREDDGTAPWYKRIIGLGQEDL